MDRRIGYLLKRVQMALRAEMDHILVEKGLTTPQYSALCALESHPGISNAELARQAFVTPQTMIRIVENLEAMGHVARASHPTHGKILMTTLTRKGARLVASCHADIAAVEEHLFGPLSRGERAMLQTLLERCAHALEGVATPVT